MVKYRHLKDGVFVRELALHKLRKVNSLVLDIDGVILDVRDSFRVAISNTVQYFFSERLAFKGSVTLLSPRETQLFKLAGGFNNDWELTYAACLFYLVKAAKLDSRSLYELRKKGGNIGNYTNLVRKLGGGLEGSKQACFRKLDRRETLELEKLWDTDFIRRIFQEYYSGLDYCQKLYGFTPRYVKKKGLVDQEKVIISKELVDEFSPRVAILTGRTKREANTALKRASLKGMILPNLVFTAEEGITKPDPAPLRHLGGVMKTQVGIYLGDTPDDLATVNNFKELGENFAFLSGIVYGGTSEVDLYQRKKADILATSPNDILSAVLELKGGT